jgi:hypothetical protein
MMARSGGHQESMINRLKEWLEEPDEQPPADDYYKVITDSDFYYVDEQAAAEVSAQLARRWPPRWIGLIEIFGARIRVLGRTIEAICESKRDQRSNEREFRRARGRERKDGQQPWDDEDGDTTVHRSRRRSVRCRGGFPGIGVRDRDCAGAGRRSPDCRNTEISWGGLTVRG